MACEEGEIYNLVRFRGALVYEIYLSTKKQYIKKNIQTNKNIKCLQTFKLLKYVYSLHCCISILKSIIFFHFLLRKSYNK